MLLELLQEMLKAEFDEVLTAENPKEALKLATSHVGRTDLLITDVIMPGMNGRVFADKFAELHPNAKVLFMSGYTENLALDLEPTSSEIALLQKPFTKSALTCKVRELLQQFVEQYPESANEIPAERALAVPSVARYSKT